MLGLKKVSNKYISICIVCVLILFTACTNESSESSSHLSSEFSSTLNVNTPSESSNNESIIREDAPSAVRQSLKEVHNNYGRIQSVFSNEDNTKSLVIDIITNQNSPEDNVREFMDTVNNIKLDCATVLLNEGYNSVICNFEVADFDGKIYFFISLKPQGNQFIIDLISPADLVVKSDDRYVDAISTVIGEISLD